MPWPFSLIPYPFPIPFSLPYPIPFLSGYPNNNFPPSAKTQNPGENDIGGGGEFVLAKDAHRYGGGGRIVGGVPAG